MRETPTKRSFVDKVSPADMLAEADDLEEGTIGEQYRKEMEAGELRYTPRLHKALVCLSRVLKNNVGF